MVQEGLNQQALNLRLGGEIRVHIHQTHTQTIYLNSTLIKWFSLNTQHQPTKVMGLLLLVYFYLNVKGKEFFSKAYKAKKVCGSCSRWQANYISEMNSCLAKIRPTCTSVSEITLDRPQSHCSLLLSRTQYTPAFHVFFFFFLLQRNFARRRKDRGLKVKCCKLDDSRSQPNVTGRGEKKGCYEKKWFINGIKLSDFMPQHR